MSYLRGSSRLHVLILLCEGRGEVGRHKERRGKKGRREVEAGRGPARACSTFKAALSLETSWPERLKRAETKEFIHVERLKIKNYYHCFSIVFKVKCSLSRSIFFQRWMVWKNFKTECMYILKVLKLFCLEDHRWRADRQAGGALVPRHHHLFKLLSNLIRLDQSHKRPSCGEG